MTVSSAFVLLFTPLREFVRTMLFFAINNGLSTYLCLCVWLCVLYHSRYSYAKDFDLSVCSLFTSRSILVFFDFISPFDFSSSTIPSHLRYRSTLLSRSLRSSILLLWCAHHSHRFSSLHFFPFRPCLSFPLCSFISELFHSSVCQFTDVKG